MNKIIHKADLRGYADHDWLKSNHSFSFAGYHNPAKMNFGALRVLNDDIVKPGFGFDTHQHNNMEIISIPLRSTLTHKDSRGNAEDLTTGEIQIMSAGTGIEHSEYNNSDTELNFLQLWIFPKIKNIEPKYSQKKFNPEAERNSILTVVSPNDSEVLTINQDAYISLSYCDAENFLDYSIKSLNNGIYIFVIEGEIKIDDEILYSRDAIGIWNTESVGIKTVSDSKILFIEVPMEW